MKKILASLLAAALAAGSAYAVAHSKKTFFMPRAVGVNKAMEHAGWHDLVYWQQSHKNPLALSSSKGLNERNTRIPRSFVSVTGLYQQSLNNEAIGNYFGVGNGMNSFRVGERLNRVNTAGGLEVENNSVAVNDQSVAIDSRFLIHDHRQSRRNAGGPIPGGAGTFNGTISFKPRIQVGGVRLDYWQDLGTPFKGLFFKATMPLVHVDHKVGLKIEGQNTVRLHDQDLTLQDFFSGKVKVDGANIVLNDKQNSLKKLKITGRRTSAGLADLVLALGYRNHASDKKYAHVSAQVTIPTGSKVRSDYLFEPIVGNGHHLGLGISAEGGVRLWQADQASAMLHLSASYNYLFEGTEQRTLSLKGHPLSHYYLAAEIPPVQRAVTAEPLANFLTRPLRIKPGSQFDALMAVSFENSRFVVDFGYNMFWKDREAVWLKENLENKYGVINRGLQLATGDTHLPASYLDGHFIQQGDIDIDSVRVPTQLTHKLIGGISYKPQCLSKQYPVIVSLGGSYEFVQDNAALEQFTSWLKLGIGF